MDASVQARMFEPFFTTKPSGNGTGLGLAAVFGIVRQARGAIRATSSPGVGTTFTIFWPAATLSPIPLPPGDQTPIDSSGEARGGRVLVVEDDDTVRRISRRILEDANFVVYSASDGERALACLEELRAAGTPPDAVLSDVLMPRLGGRGLAEQLGRLYPELPVILMSGHSDFGDVRDGLANTPFPVLVKPFDVAQLVHVVSQAVALGRESSGRSTD
jgi:CheY-like chemotaxis protein